MSTLATYTHSLTKKEICQKWRISRSTLYRFLNGKVKDEVKGLGYSTNDKRLKPDILNVIVREFGEAYT